MPDQIYKFAPEEVWFTSDTHFGHENIIRYCNRPFKNAEHWNDILSALPGRKYLILGNHDMKCIRQGFMSHFEMVTQQMTIRVGGQAIVLNHNPFLCYGGSYRDVWQLFGHVHSGPLSTTGLDHPRLKMLFPLQYDVGVDNNDFRPVSFAQVKAKIEAQVAAAKAAAGIKDDGITSEVRRIVFVDKGASIGPAETKRLREVATDIIELDSSVPVKEAIAARVSLLTGNIRYVYIGSQPLDDFRYVPIKSGTPITMAGVESAIKIL